MAGDGMPGLASKLNFLFATVPRAAHLSQLHTNETAAAALDAFGVRVTKTHLSHLRAGRRDNPSARLLAGLAHLFGVPIAYFFDEEREGAPAWERATSRPAWPAVRSADERMTVGRQGVRERVPECEL